MPDVTQQLVNPQVVEIEVTGPDGANRLFLCSGQVNYWVSASGQLVLDVVTFHVGPQLARREIIRATCAVGILGYYASGTPAVTSGGAYIRNADADWDDEGERVQVRLEVEATGMMGARGFGYQVMILAERAQ